MKRTYFLVILLFVSVFTITLISAFWPFTGNVITGNVADNMVMGDSQTCMDSDGGVFALIPGSVIDVGNSKIYKDSCSGSNVPAFYDSNNKKISGKSKIIEYYCENGAMRNVTKTSAELTDGACILSTESSSNGLAYWKTKEKKCIVDPLGLGVIDENGKKWYNGCGTGTNKSKLFSYTCNGNEVATDTIDCTTDGYKKCQNNANRTKKDFCIGKCTETDEVNNKNVGGIVTITTKSFTGSDEKTYSDKCIGKTNVKQYKCNKDGSLGILDQVACGANRGCVVSVGGDLCKDKYANESLADKVKELEGYILGVNADGSDGILNRLEKLECQINPNTDCCTDNPTTPGCS